MIKIEQEFNQRDIENDFLEFADHAELEIVSAMKKAGQLVVDSARQKTRESGGFANITFNLRASIGYVISDPNGQVIDVYFPSIGKGEEGRLKGIEYGHELATMFNDGDYMLFIIAGMEYAALVEARSDVISGSLGLLQKEIESLLR